MKLTSIFPPHIKPVRKGVYKTTGIKSTEELYCYSYWNGYQWGYFAPNKETAYHYREQRSEYQNKRWQGILK